MESIRGHGELIAKRLECLSVLEWNFVDLFWFGFRFAGYRIRPVLVSRSSGLATADTVPRC